MTPDPRHLSSSQRAQRNQRIAFARAEGQGWREIAEREGLSVRQAARAAEEHRSVAAFRRVAAAPEVDPGALLREVIDGHRAAAERLEALSLEGDNDSARVGAASARARVLRDLFGVAERAGLLPGPDLWRGARDLHGLARALAIAAMDAGVSAEAVLAVADQEASPSDGAPVPAGLLGAAL